jgi:tetratricopeptide (TPR) repeat protein
MNLAISLRTRFKQQTELKTLDEAIAFSREALQLRPPGHPTRNLSLMSLAISLQIRFDQQGELDTLDEAIALYREALQLCPPGYPGRNLSLMNLAISLKTRFEQQGELETLDEAIALHHEALKLCPPGHPDRFRSLFAIAGCLLVFERLDFTTAAALISEALKDKAASIRNRLNEAQRILPATDDAYAALASLEAGHTTRAIQGNIVVQLYNEAIQLLPRAANFGLDTSTRLQAIKGSDQLSRDGAVRAIDLGQLEEAVVMLEEGRGIFWSQTLHLRAAGLDSVPENDRHDLGEVFRVLQSDSSIIRDASRPVQEREGAVVERRKLNEKAEALISKIRAYPGLERFLLPPTFDSLMASLPVGFVVILNSSRLGCRALLLNRATGLAKSLAVTTNISSFDLKIARTRLPRDMVSAELIPEVEEEIRGLKVAGKKVTTFEDMLQNMWLSLVRPVLLALGLKVGGPRFSS